MNAVTLYQRGLWEEAACFCFGLPWCFLTGTSGSFPVSQPVQSKQWSLHRKQPGLLQSWAVWAAPKAEWNFLCCCRKFIFFWEMWAILGDAQCFHSVAESVNVGQWLHCFKKFSASGSSDCISGPAVQILSSQSHPRRDVWLLPCANLRKEEGERGQPSANQEVCD